MSGRLEDRELAAVRWLLGQLMVLVSLGGAFALDLGADPLITVCLVATVLSCLAPALVERIPQLLWRVAPLLLLGWIVTDFVRSGSDVLPPLFRMVLALTLYRALQVRTPREDLQLLLLSLFLLVVTGVLSQEITFGVQLLVYAPLAMGQLFAVNLATRDDGTGSNGASGRVFTGFRWRRLMARAWERFDRRTLTAGVLIFIATTGMALLFFLFLPRFDIGAALPFPRLQTGRSLSGFTDHVRYGDVTSILEDDAIAMRVDVEAEAPPARPYWRMVALDAYYDGGFMVSPRVARVYRNLQNYQFDFGGGPETPRSTWTLYLEGGVSAYLPAGDTFRQLRFKNRTTLQVHDLTRVFRTSETNANTLSLRYEDLGFGGVLPYGDEDAPLPRLQPLATDTSRPDYLRDVTYPQTLLVVPEGEANTAVFRDVLSGIGFERGMPVDEFAGRLVDHLQRGRGYSLESRIPGGEGDSLLRWIVSGGAGHCELYAGAFVLVSRYAGYPARLVTGFAGGDWNGFENYFMVRNRNAHAWCEIFDPARGWVRVDPTPGYGAEGSVDAALAGGRLVLDRTWQARLDSLRILWFRRVIQFDSEDQLYMAEAFRDSGSKGLEWIRALAGEARTLFKRDWRALTETGNWKGLAVHGIVPLAALVLTVCLCWLVLRRRRRLSREALLRRRAGNLIRARRMRGLPEDGPAHELLQLIRYGPENAWPADASRILRRGRKLVAGNQPTSLAANPR